MTQAKSDLSTGAGWKYFQVKYVLGWSAQQNVRGCTSTYGQWDLNHLGVRAPYVLMGDGLVTMTPGHTSLDTGEPEGRTNKWKNCELSNKELIQQKQPRAHWSPTALGSDSLPWKLLTLGVPWCPHL